MKRNLSKPFVASISALLLSISAVILLSASQYQKESVFAAGSGSVRAFISIPQMRRVSDVRGLLFRLSKMGIDVPGVNLAKKEIEVLGSEDQINELTKRGLTLRSEKRTSRVDRSLDPRYLNPDSMAKAVKQIADKFPKFSKVYEIGKTLQGRSILALVVAENPDINDPKFANKPTILLDALHHAREVMTPEIVLDAAVTLLQGASRGNRGAQRALSLWNFALIPMVNPDGSAIVFKNDNMWRKNARPNSNGNIEGVDINRNYSFNWNKCGGSSGSWGAQDFRGPTPASEPETKALIAFAEQVRPVINISYHSYSELILYPYGCEGAYTGDHDLHKAVAQELSKLLPNDSGGGFYEPGTPWEILYDVDGDSISQMHAEFGALSYVLEINEEFQPSYDIRNKTVEKHRKAWQGLLAMTETKMLALNVIDGKTGMGANSAKVEISNIPFKFGEASFVTLQNGKFFKVLYPNNYSVRVTLKDGRSATADFQHTGKAATALEIKVQ